MYKQKKEEIGRVEESLSAMGVKLGTRHKSSDKGDVF